MARAACCIYLDTNIFVYALEASGILAESCEGLLRLCHNHQGTAFTSELTLAEVLCKVEADRNIALKRSYLELLLWSNAVTLLPVTRTVLMESARLRAYHPGKLNLADAIHAVTAIEQACSDFISNDDGIFMPDNGPVKRKPDADTVRDIAIRLAAP